MRKIMDFLPFLQMIQNFRELLTGNLKGILGGQNYQYEEGNDHIIMTYQKDGVTYQTEIVPKSDGADASYVKNYHVYPAQGKFAYRTVTADTYYLCRLKMTTRQVGTDLWIEKKVAGGAADPKEHFTFVLTKTSLAGTSYRASGNTYI